METVLYTYTPRYGPWLYLLGILLAIGLLRVINVWREHGWETKTLATLAVFSLCTLVLSAISLNVVLTSLRSVEILNTGTLNFVTPLKRESFPIATLSAVEGYTRPGVYMDFVQQSSSHYIRFRFSETSQDLNTKEAYINRDDFPKIANFVNQLEQVKPSLNTSDFWSWSEAYNPKL